MLNANDAIQKMRGSTQQNPSTSRTHSSKLLSRRSAPSIMSLNPPAQRPIDNQQVQESQRESYDSPEVSLLSSVNTIRNIGQSSRRLSERTNSLPRPSSRLSIGLKRSTANRWLIGIFCSMLAILLWAHFAANGKSDVFRHLEDAATKNNGSVVFGQFRNVMFEKERVSDTEWNRFLDEVQNDHRLQYVRNEKGDGILKFDL